MSDYRDIEFTLCRILPLDISVSTGDMEIDIGMSDSGGGKLPTYEGEYVVIPKPFTEQVLETKNKSLVDDVTVLEIPYSEVTNPEGGITANIGYEL